MDVTDRIVVRDHDVSGLSVCATCAELRGPVVDEQTGQRRIQQCACDRSADGAVRWPGWDVSAVAELCHCCARVVVPSGSRWSRFFCDACHALVFGLNRASGACVVPIGRHSVMNGVFLGGGRPTTTSDVDRFMHDLASFTDRLHHLDRWRASRARLVLGSFDAPGDVDLATYLARAAEVLPRPRVALDEMLRAG